MHWLLARLSSNDKRGITLVNIFQKITPKGRKPNNMNNIWIDQGAEFYNNFLWKFLKINNIEMYSTYNEGKPVVAEKFIATLKNKILKHMISVSNNVYFNVLDAIVSKYKDAVHRSIKMKPTEVISDSYGQYNEDSSKKDSKLKVGDRVRISKYKNLFANGYKQNWSEEIFIISKI